MAFKHRLDLLQKQVDRLADKIQDLLEHTGLADGEAGSTNAKPAPKTPPPPPQE
jgi:hypothetical protein